MKKEVLTLTFFLLRLSSSFDFSFVSSVIDIHFLPFPSISTVPSLSKSPLLFFNSHNFQREKALDSKLRFLASFGVDFALKNYNLENSFVFSEEEPAKVILLRRKSSFFGKEKEFQSSFFLLEKRVLSNRKLAESPKANENLRKFCKKLKKIYVSSFILCIFHWRNRKIFLTEKGNFEGKAVDFLSQNEKFASNFLYRNLPKTFHSSKQTLPKHIFSLLLTGKFKKAKIELKSFRPIEKPPESLLHFKIGLFFCLFSIISFEIFRKIGHRKKRSVFGEKSTFV